jgi:hypothetical protein
MIKGTYSFLTMFYGDVNNARNMGGWGFLGQNANPYYPRKGRGPALGGGAGVGFGVGGAHGTRGNRSPLCVKPAPARV